MDKLISKIDKNDSVLELQFGINKNQYNSLSNILTNRTTQYYLINRTTFDDEDNNIIKEEIYPLVKEKNGYIKEQVYYDKYKQVYLLDKFNVTNSIDLLLTEELELTDEISELYDEGILPITKFYSNNAYLIILETGVQAYLSEILVTKNNLLSIKEEQDNNKYLNEEVSYNLTIDFNTKIIKKYKLHNIIDKYIRKINYYINISNILKNKVTKAFSDIQIFKRGVNELNKLLNKPLTLEKKYMPKLGVNYCITDKADGIRLLLIIDKYGSGYLINNKFEIVFMFKNPLQLPNGAKNCILDGEYIATEKTYLIFDIIQYDNKNLVANKEFVERLKYLSLINDSICIKSHNLLYDTEKLSIKIKKFYVIDTFLSLKSKMTDEEKAEVRAYNFLSVLKVDKYKEVIQELWNERVDKFTYLLDGLILTPLDGLYIDKQKTIFKWKELHTIDVRVFENEEHDMIWNFDVNRNSKLDKDFIKNYIYDEKLNNITNIYFASGDIVEFAWNKEQQQFIPLRIRDDKIIPNARKTVESVIQAIQEDITINDILEINDNTGNIFYQELNMNKSQRAKSVDINMKNFHNYIKTKLIEYPSEYQRGNSILDISAGKGGDIHKYRHSGYSRILACDISTTAIEQFNMRLKTLEKQKKLDNINITLINADCTKNLVSAKAGLNDIENKKLQNYFQENNQQFDKIVCNFAISYMFLEDKTASGFFQNIKDCMGKYFVGTFIDGDMLDKHFVNNTTNEIIAKKNGDEFYVIKPIGEYRKQSADNHVLISRPGIGGWENPIPEPVIYKKQLIKSFENIGIKNYFFKDFSEYYNDFLNEKNEKLDKDEQLISFLHKTFIVEL